MTLTLRAVSLNDHPLTQPITVHFDAQGGSIGRADHNTMALPDPKRHISRQQAEVATAGNAFSITNVGSANPIVVGTRSLARGESAALAQGDRLRIGGYLLEVELRDAESAEAASVSRGRAAVDAATPPHPRAAVSESASHAGDPAGALSPGNPFASLFSAGSGAAVGADAVTPAGAGVAASADAVWPTPPADAVWPRLPDDFDPFAPPAAAPAPAPAASPAGVFGDLVPGTQPVSIDRLFGLDAGEGRDPLADFLAGGAPLPPAAARDAASPAPIADDPLVALGFAVAGAPNGRATGSDHVPELKAAFAPPRLLRSGPAPAGPAPRAETDAGAAAWASFCKGAGLSIDRPEGDDADTWRLVGELLRAGVDGTLRLMAVRASSKHELRAPVTVIQPQRNNPLKFSPDANAALEQLLQPPLRGFLPGPAAVADAMDDLVGHAIGTLAGTRAALEGVLDRFAPGQLESKLAARSVLDSVLPMNRKARLWELYLQHFETIRSEAQDDFQTLFGRAFLAAYEAQLERLRDGASHKAP